MDVQKARIQSDGSLDKLKLIIVVRGDLQNKEMVGYTWSPTASMRTQKYLLADATKNKSGLHQLDFIGAFLQEKVKSRVFVKLDIRYIDYFPEYAKYFERALRLLKSMYGMKKSGQLFADELTEWLLEAVFIQSQCQMSIYYKYAPDGSKNFILSYVDDCVQWYTNEDIGKWFVDNLGKRFHVNLQGYAHWFMSIRISQLKDHYISVDQAKYATSIVAEYLDTATVKVSTKFYKTTLPADMIFSKEDVSTSDEKFEKLNREYSIHYRACVGSFIYLLSTRVDLSFGVHKLAKFSANPGKVHFEVLIHLLI